MTSSGCMFPHCEMAKLHRCPPPPQPSQSRPALVPPPARRAVGAHQGPWGRGCDRRGPNPRAPCPSLRIHAPAHIFMEPDRLGAHNPHLTRRYFKKFPHYFYFIYSLFLIFSTKIQGTAAGGTVRGAQGCRALPSTLFSVCRDRTTLSENAQNTHI